MYDDSDFEPDPDYGHDIMVEERTDWDRIDWHKPEGAKGYAMAAAELRKPCERLGCTCPWSRAPEGTQVIARGLPGTVRAYPTSWQPFPGWVPVEYRTGLSLTRISDIEKISQEV